WVTRTDAPATLTRREHDTPASTGPGPADSGAGARRWQARSAAARAAYSGYAGRSPDPPWRTSSRTYPVFCEAARRSTGKRRPAPREEGRAPVTHACNERRPEFDDRYSRRVGTRRRRRGQG